MQAEQEELLELAVQAERLVGLKEQLFPKDQHPPGPESMAPAEWEARQRAEALLVEEHAEIMRRARHIASARRPQRAAPGGLISAFAPDTPTKVTPRIVHMELLRLAQPASPGFGQTLRRPRRCASAPRLGREQRGEQTVGNPAGAGGEN